MFQKRGSRIFLLLRYSGHVWSKFFKISEVFCKRKCITGPQIFYTILGMAIAFGVSVYSIQFLMGYVRRHDFKFFGYYRIILGVVVLAYFGITALAA